MLKKQHVSKWATQSFRKGKVMEEALPLATSGIHGYPKSHLILAEQQGR